jgi:hypothetical protein
LLDLYTREIFWVAFSRVTQTRETA